MLVLQAEVTTATEYLSLSNEGLIGTPQEGSLCDGSEDPLSMSQFLDECGTSYHSRRDMGGALFFMLNMETLSSSQKTELQVAPSVGNERQNVDLDSQLTQIRDATSNSQEIYLWTRGFSNLPSGLGSKTDVGTLLNWVNSLDKNDGSAIMEQHFERYSLDVLQGCGFDNDVIEAFECPQDFFDEREKFFTQGTFHEDLGFLRHAIDNISDYRFDTNPAEVSKLLDDVDTCQQAYNTANSACLQAVDNNDFNNLCSACAVPEPTDGNGDPINCSAQPLFVRTLTLVDLIYEKPEPQPVYDSKSCGSITCAPPADYVVEQGSGDPELDRDNLFCTFNGMVGRFAGGGEEINVLPDQDFQGSPIWSVTVNSGRTASEERIKAFVSCSNRANFYYNAANSPVFQTPNATSITANATQNTPEPASTHLTALSGITGKMEGGGEFATVFKKNGNLQIQSASQQGYLEAWFTSFGPLTSAGGAPYTESYNGKQVWEWNTVVGGDHDRVIKLASAEQAHCYLTNIKGEFDGHAEYVRLFVKGDDKHWRVRVRASDEPKTVEATVRCISYDQT